MPRNGSGTYTLPTPENPVVADTVIDPDDHNTTMDDVADALTDSLTANGEKEAEANQPMGGFKHTNVAVATARTEYLRASQDQDSSLRTAVPGGTTNAITLTLAPAITAMALGQRFHFIAAATNTDVVTLHVNGVGSALAVKKNGGLALLPGDIVAGQAVDVQYDGTDFELLNPTKPAGASVRLAAGIGAALAADTNENTAATITLPAAAMGANGHWRLTMFWAVNNDASAKTARVRWSGGAGTVIFSQDAANQNNMAAWLEVANKNATNAQSSFSQVQLATTVAGTTTNDALTVDTTAASTIVITGQKADGTDTMTLNHYLVELIQSA